MTFSRLFEMGTFSVPWHQRYYDWEKGHVTELLKDIDEACLEQRACYFLGSIMLIEAEGDHWEINDGQQRMITVSLIIAWLCRLASDENPDHQRVKTALDKLFVLPPDEVCSLNDADRYRPRIDPPRHNRSQYHQLICGQSIGTNGKLTSAWVEIQTFLAHKSPSDAYRYFDYLVQNTEVAVLRVPEKVDANSVYETLNYRGKKLDAVDLIRNHLYSFFSKDRDQPRRQTVHEGLERIGKTLSRRGKSKSRSAEEFVRCYAQCLFGLLQPIVVCQAEDGDRWEILTGQRRFLAHQRLERDSIYAAILDERVDEAEAKAISITENLVRRKLTGRDLKDGILFLYNRYGSVRDVADKTGISQNQVRANVKYPRLHSRLQQLVDDNAVPIQVAVKANDAAMDASGEVNPDEAEKLAREMAPMADVQRRKLIQDRREHPEKSVDDVIEHAKTGGQIIQVITTVSAQTHAAIQRVAKEEGLNQDEATSMLIEEALAGRGAFEEE